ncbi:proton pump-interactor 1-like [Dorcoceras hygrometricum]|uniref:Proton pump-interactor 1-like n=1 Tax=Dorcoceras hygrometricum TaxID=472368 RepID=A0A2Z7C7W6_9LAMI|nr:proton pump-interactor 1-like [Dorcoceras hygrometricum]
MHRAIHAGRPRNRWGSKNCATAGTMLARTLDSCEYKDHRNSLTVGGNKTHRNKSMAGGTTIVATEHPKAYVVFVGREPGVYEKWSEASKQVCGFSGSCYKGYETKKDAEEAFRSFVQSPDASGVYEKCECEKTSTTSTSRPHRPNNSQKLVKVLRDLAVEIHNHATRMEKVVEEIGQILEDMQLNDGE